MSVPWKEGIKGIAKQSYYYRYFNLINPPQQSMLYDYYCQTMGFIDREVSSIIRLIEKDRDIKTRIRELEERFKEEENNSIKLENEELQKENNYLRNFLEKTYEYVSILFDFPKDRLKRLVKDFINKIKE